MKRKNIERIKNMLNSEYSMFQIARPSSWKIKNTGISLSNKFNYF